MAETHCIQKLFKLINTLLNKCQQFCLIKLFLWIGCAPTTIVICEFISIFVQIESLILGVGVKLGTPGNIL